MWVASEQPFGAHQLSGSAKPALWSVVLYECSLQWIKLVTMCQALYGADFSPVGPHSQIAARIHGLAVEQDGAGSALAAIAADLRAGEAKVIAQEFGKSPTIFDVKPMLSAIHH
jgi:hypothetical protein